MVKTFHFNKIIQNLHCDEKGHYLKQRVKEVQGQINFVTNTCYTNHSEAKQKVLNFEVRYMWVYILALASFNLVTLFKLFNLSETEPSPL